MLMLGQELTLPNQYFYHTKFELFISDLCHKQNKKCNDLKIYNKIKNVNWPAKKIYSYLFTPVCTLFEFLLPGQVALALARP